STTRPAPAATPAAGTGLRRTRNTHGAAPHADKGPDDSAGSPAGNCPLASIATEALHHFYDIRVEGWAHCVQQPIDRGEVPKTPTPMR
ncbi:hypothetical protein ACWEQZ_35700, partial [Streptomyces spiralis]